MEVPWEDSVLGDSLTDLGDNNEVCALFSARNLVFHLFDGMVHSTVWISHFQGLHLGDDIRSDIFGGSMGRFRFRRFPYGSG